ncbi:MAG TPA: 3-phosphoshikimate 1-carboxyvinyltransferase [Flavobacterium sp.]|nr:3-phosphoshikimate 1-carboxyvinyltransferase [Flavobacterium sp.]
MDITLDLKNFISDQHITISGSKSETNRLLVLQALYPDLLLENISNSDDSKVMTKALSAQQSHNIDIHHAGTAMRFLSAYYAMQENTEVILTGSSRMKERPIQILVDALQQLGANISYLEKDGFPPLKIVGKNLSKNQVIINANVSSQYISALMLIGAALPNGLKINLKGNITSAPYIRMTLQMLNTLGINADFNENRIKILPAHQLKNTHFTVESDWSSASYFYSIIALAPIGSRISLSYFKPDSLQGDAILAEIYKDFGVQTTFQNAEIILEKTVNCQLSTINYQLNNTPDIAQTLIITCLGLGITCTLTGLHTLKIKETDRLQALKNELEKFGAEVAITDDSIELKNTVVFTDSVIEIETYQDHRMAMAFAPLAFRQKLRIKNAEVVSKSYPGFWEDLKVIGLHLKRI